MNKDQAQDRLDDIEVLLGLWYDDSPELRAVTAKLREVAPLLEDIPDLELQSEYDELSASDDCARAVEIRRG